MQEEAGKEKAASAKLQRKRNQSRKSGRKITSLCEYWKRMLMLLPYWKMMLKVSACSEVSFCIWEEKIFRTEEEQFHAYRQVLQTMAG